VTVRQKFSGHALRARRRHLGLSRDVLAFTVGRTVGSIANYERGLTTPSAETLAALADFLQCAVQDFFVQEHADV
jgi:transcriptional regulator with XRE-family HTH domain